PRHAWASVTAPCAVCSSRVRSPQLGTAIAFALLRGDIEAYAAAPAAPAASAAATVRQASADSAALVELVHLVDRLQHEVVARTEAASLWQARAELLGAQLERAQLALAAPTQPTMPEIAPGSESERVADQRTEGKPHSRNGRPGGRRGGGKLPRP